METLFDVTKLVRTSIVKQIADDIDDGIMGIAYDRKNSTAFMSYAYLIELIGEEEMEKLKVGDSVGNYICYAMTIKGLRFNLNPKCQTKRLNLDWREE